MSDRREYLESIRQAKIAKNNPDPIKIKRNKDTIKRSKKILENTLKSIRDIEEDVEDLLAHFEESDGK